MTFDFAPNWLDAVSANDGIASPAARAAFVPAQVAPQPAAAATRPPAPPSMTEVAQLVGELFTEGTLSFEQLCSLSNAPEMVSLLDATVAGVAPRRRSAAGR